MASRRTPAEHVIQFIERYYVVPDGTFIGQPLRLAPFQREFVELVYGNPAGTRRAILSVGRKNAKSSLAACLLLNHLCGPSAEDRPNAQLYSTAQSLDQAALIFMVAAKMVRLNPALASIVRIQESRRSLSCPDLGTVYRALSADSNVAHGLNPQFCVHDELGRVREPRSALFDAMESGAVALVDPLSIIISTQSASDSDLLSILIDDALSGQDPKTVIKLYAAPADIVDPYSEEAVRLANPAFDVFLNREIMLAEGAKARRLPSFEASYKNLTLNMRIESLTGVQFVDGSLWRACCGEPQSFAGLTAFAGLDLSSTSDLTAMVLAGLDPTTGIWSVKPIFWLPEEGLSERAGNDRAPYDLWTERGYIELTPGTTVSYEYVAGRLRDIIDDHDVKKIAFDDWNMHNFKPWLTRAGFSDARIAETFLNFR